MCWPNRASLVPLNAVVAVTLLPYAAVVPAGADVDCTTLAPETATVTYNNDVGPKILTIGMIGSGAGLGGPVDIADCVYISYHPPLVPDDFRIFVTEAQGPMGGAVAATVEVSAVDCGSAP